MKYKLVISYDGTDFMGWQVQQNLPTIAGTLQATYKKTFGQEGAVLGASRTDAGVHAYGQVALLRTEHDIDPNRMKSAWNTQLPSSITIVSCQVILGSSFHPFYNVIHKEYWYQVFTQQPTPFVVRYGWHYKPAIDLEVLRNALQLFVGTHDFTAFCAGVQVGGDALLTIDSIVLEIIESGGGLRIIIKGKKFLQHMIRRIVGAAVHVASRPDLTIDAIAQLLESKNPNHSLPRAPAQGLILREIMYKQTE